MASHRASRSILLDVMGGETASPWPRSALEKRLFEASEPPNTYKKRRKTMENLPKPTKNMLKTS